MSASSENVATTGSGGAALTEQHELHELAESALILASSVVDLMPTESEARALLALLVAPR